MPVPSDGRAVQGRWSETASSAVPRTTRLPPCSRSGVRLLYLVTEELLVDAHASGETTLGTAMFFVGFLAFLLLGMVE